MPDPVFRGMNRPATWLGVPIMPLFFVYGGVITCVRLIMFVWSSPWAFALLLVLIPLHLFMMEVTRTKPQMWRQIWLWILFNVIRFDISSRFWGASTYGVKRQK